MKDLDTLCLYCTGVLDSLNIPYDRNVSVKYNGRISRKWGYCRKLPQGHFEISVSVVLGEDDAPDKAIKSVIFHELLHTCPGCMNHGKKWKEYARVVSKITGVRIRAVSDAESMKIKEKYIVKCRKCKYKMRFPMRPRDCKRYCPVCGSSRLSCYTKENGQKIKIWKRGRNIVSK